MRPNTTFRIVVLPGDGIGHEVMPPCLEVLRAATNRVGGFDLHFEEHPAGAEVYRDTGNALPRSTLEASRRADAILLGAMGLPHIRYPDGTEIAPQLDLRFEFGLYAGVRPIRATPGVPPVIADSRAKDIDLVIIRESTEGLFASRGKGAVEGDREARDTLVITRDVCERLFDFSFRLAEARKRNGGKGRVTCVDKANVFKSFAFFRRIFDERALRFPEIAADHV
jgi:3-isopropylmalate dehydrogenase